MAKLVKLVKNPYYKKNQKKIDYRRIGKLICIYNFVCIYNFENFAYVGITRNNTCLLLCLQDTCFLPTGDCTLYSELE